MADFDPDAFAEEVLKPVAPKDKKPVSDEFDPDAFASEFNPDEFLAGMEPERSTLSKVGSAVAYPFKKAFQGLGWAQEKTTIPALKEAQEAVSGSFLESAQKSRELAKTTPKEETLKKLREARFSPLGDIESPPELSGVGEGLVGAAASTLLMPTSLIDLAGMGVGGKAAKSVKAGEVAAIPEAVSGMEKFKAALKAMTPGAKSDEFLLKQAEDVRALAIQQAKADIAKGLNPKENFAFLRDIQGEAGNQAISEARKMARATKATAAHGSLTKAEAVEKEMLSARRQAETLRKQVAEAEALAAKTATPNLAPNIAEATAPHAQSLAKSQEKLARATAKIDDIKARQPELYEYLSKQAEGALTNKPVGDITGKMEPGSEEMLAYFIRSPKTQEEAALLAKAGVIKPVVTKGSVIPKATAKAATDADVIAIMEKSGYKLRNAKGELADNLPAIISLNPKLKGKTFPEVQAIIQGFEDKANAILKSPVSLSTTTEAWELTADGRRLTKQFSASTRAVRESSDEIAKAQAAMRAAEQGVRAKFSTAPLGEMATSLRETAITKADEAKRLLAEAETRAAALSQEVSGARKGADYWAPVRDVASGNPSLVRLGEAELRTRYGLKTEQIKDLVQEYKDATKGLSAAEKASVAQVAAKAAPEAAQTPSLPLAAKTAEAAPALPTPTLPQQAALDDVATAAERLAEQRTAGRVEKYSDISDPQVRAVQKTLEEQYRAEKASIPFSRMDKANYAEAEVAAAFKAMREADKVPGLGAAFMVDVVDDLNKSLSGLVGKNAQEIANQFDGVRDAAMTFLRAGTERGRSLGILSWKKEMATQKLLAHLGKATDTLKASGYTIDNKIIQDLEFVRRQLAEKKIDPSLINKIYGAYLSFLLSGPITHAKNMAGNLGMLALMPIEKFSQAGVAQLASKFKWSPAERAEMALLAKNNWRDGIAMSKELGAIGRQAATISKDVAKNAVDTFLNTGVHPKDFWRQWALKNKALKFDELPFQIEDFAKTGAKFDAPLVPLETKWANTLLNAPSKLLDVEDNVFKYLVARVKYSADKAKGMSGRELYQSLSEEATYRTFQNSSDIANALSILKGMPVARWFMPFVKTGSNIISVGLERSPIGVYKYISRRVDDARKVGLPYTAEERVKDLTNVALGTMAWGALYAAHKQGKITGSYPTKPTDRMMWEAEQKQPFSIKIAGKWIPIDKLEPFGTTIRGIMGAIDGYRDSEESIDEIAGQASAEHVPDMLVSIGKEMGKSAVGVARGLRETVRSSPMYGISTMLDAINDPDRTWGKMIKSYAASAIPTLSKFGAEAMSGPYKKETISLGETLKNRIPMANTGLVTALNMFGDPIERRSTFSGSTPAREYPELNYLKEAGADISRFDKDLDGIPLDSEGKAKFRRLFGNMFKRKVNEIMNVVPTSRLSNEKVKAEVKRYLEDTIADTKAFLNYSLKGYETLKYYKVPGNFRPEELIHIGDVTSQKGFTSKPYTQRRLLLNDYIKNQLPVALEDGRVETSLDKYVSKAKKLATVIGTEVTEEDVLNDETLSYSEKRDILQEKFGGLE